MLVEQGGIPSGPGALSGVICFKAVTISYSRKVLVSDEFMSLVITKGMRSREATCGSGFDVE